MRPSAFASRVIVSSFTFVASVSIFAINSTGKGGDLGKRILCQPSRFPCLPQVTREGAPDFARFVMGRRVSQRATDPVRVHFVPSNVRSTSEWVAASRAAIARETSVCVRCDGYRLLVRDRVRATVTVRKSSP